MADHVVELKLDRSLIDSQFDGYKLSLDPLPIYRSTLNEEPDIAKLSEDQHSYQHIRAFGLTNHIIADPWDLDRVFVINQSWEVLQITIALETSADNGRVVFTIPDRTEKINTSGRVNISLRLVSEDKAVIADGAGTILILDTGPRQDNNNKWQILHQFQPLENNKPFIITDAAIKQLNDTVVLDCIALHVEETAEDRKGHNSAPFETLLEWLTFRTEGSDWQLYQTRRFVSYRCPEYTFIDSKTDSIIICNQQPVRMIFDSLKPVLKPVLKSVETKNSKEDQCEPEYTWSQTDEDISILFTVPLDVVKADIYLSLHPQQIEFGVKNSRILLQGALESHVDIDGSTWTIDNGRIMLTLCKAETCTWQMVVPGDSRGEMVVDPERVEAIHTRLSHLTSEEWNPDPKLSVDRPYNSQELEECDAFTEDSAVLQRIDGNTHNTTHQVNISSHQWLFNVQIQTDSLPALCLRHDVDGVVWQPISPTDADLGAIFKHHATFNAFGYVQASKQQKRFCTAPPNMSYVAIVDVVRHIYVYRQPAPILSPIRNRKTGRQVNAIAKQQLVALETVDDILGVHSTNERLYVLAGKTFHVIKIN